KLSPNDIHLTIKNLSAGYGKMEILHNFDLFVSKAQSLCLIGPNGAGKSTLIKILSGAQQPDNGTICFKGKNYESFSTREALNFGISVIYQELALVSEMSVVENIFLGREIRTTVGIIDSARMRQEANRLLEQMGLKINVKSEVGVLSVAYQQMVEISKALSRNADLIVMDEPSAILAGHELEQLFRTIHSLKNNGVTVIYISHRLEEVFRIADEVTVLKDGKNVVTRSVEGLTRAELVSAMVGRKLEEVFPQSASKVGECVLEAHEISTDTILQKVNLKLHRGEIVGLAGMVGSGRTELARALFGADKLTSGEIKLMGEQVEFSSPADAIRKKISLVPEDRKQQGLLTALSIKNNITLPILKKISSWFLLDRRMESKLVEYSRKQLSISMASEHLDVQFLSGGNQQKVVLAKWLHTKPEVIIMDEPTRGVDVGAKFEIYQLMRRLAEEGISILMISSELPEILGLSDRILVMSEGRIVAELDHAEASEEKIINYATMGKSKAA
ncbi:MAG: sugar ABC transporter ATP-binding protein, partial [SAR324 cluster bacterium]|nr:sugar ABC transporter ATP-binding protein [SAR324 cluster bacterium]